MMPTCELGLRTASSIFEVAIACFSLMAYRVARGKRCPAICDKRFAMCVRIVCDSTRDAICVVLSAARQRRLFVRIDFHKVRKTRDIENFDIVGRKPGGQ